MCAALYKEPEAAEAIKDMFVRVVRETCMNSNFMAIVSPHLVGLLALNVQQLRGVTNEKALEWCI